MSDRDFVLTFDYNVSAETLYEQFATAEGVQHWWTEKCEMEPGVGGRANFPFPEAGFHALTTIKRLDKNQCVEWKVTESKHPESSGWVDLHDWEGTTIRFEIEALDANRSRLHFTHHGLVPLECAESCSSLWRFYLNESLRQYFENGTGAPYRDNQ